MHAREINIAASSNPLVGAENRSADGSSFSVTLSNAIRIPERARNIQLSVDKASIWWSTPNVLAGVNDTIVIYDRRQRAAPCIVTDAVPIVYVQPEDSDPAALPAAEEMNEECWVEYRITLLPGLYGVDQINQFINDRIRSRSGRQETLVEFTASVSYDRFEVKTKQPFITIDLTRSSLSSLLGFEPSMLTGVNEGTLFLADRRVDLAPTESYLLQCSLVDDGIRVGNRQAQVVAQVPISVNVGQLIVFEPLRPPLLECEGLRAQPIRTIRFALLKDDLTPADTNGNDWSIEVKIRYLMPNPY